MLQDIKELIHHPLQHPEVGCHPSPMPATLAVLGVNDLQYMANIDKVVLEQNAFLHAFSGQSKSTTLAPSSFLNCWGKCCAKCNAFPHS